MCALAADTCGNEGVVSPAVVLYEEERSDGKQQVKAVTVFTGTLRSLTRCTADTCDNLGSKATLCASRPSVSRAICKLPTLCAC